MLKFNECRPQVALKALQVEDSGQNQPLQAKDRLLYSQFSDYFNSHEKMLYSGSMWLLTASPAKLSFHTEASHADVIPALHCRSSREQSFTGSMSYYIVLKLVEELLTLYWSSKRPNCLCVAQEAISTDGDFCADGINMLKHLQPTGLHKATEQELFTQHHIGLQVKYIKKRHLFKEGNAVWSQEDDWTGRREPLMLIATCQKSLFGL